MSFHACWLAVLWGQMYAIGYFKNGSTWFKINRTLSLTEHTPIEISNRIVGKILLHTIWYHALFFFWYGVYKYCCSTNGTVWCRDEVQRANCARTMVNRSLFTWHFKFVTWACSQSFMFSLLMKPFDTALSPALCTLYVMLLPYIY